MKMPETLIYLFLSFFFFKTCFMIGMHPANLGILDQFYFIPCWSIFSSVVLSSLDLEHVKETETEMITTSNYTFSAKILTKTKETQF